MGWLLLILSAGYYLKTVFSVPPFIEQEAAIQAYWWMKDTQSFFFKLFEPGMNDGGPGRFRFLDYLFTAGYWKLNEFGLLPRDLYDYSAIALNLIVALCLFYSAKRAKLAELYQGLIPAAFLLSCQAFHTSVWHYRKAKLISTLWLIFFIWAFRSPVSRRRNWILGTLTVLSVLTDPYLILMIPILVVCFEGVKSFTQAMKAVLIGYGVSGFLIILLNGVIGPAINARCALRPSGIHDPTGTLLTFSNAFRFYDIFPDIWGPTWAGRAGELFWFWAIALTIGYGVWVYKSKSRIGLALLASLPVVAFMVKPESDQANFSGYYGHCLLVLLLFSVIEMLEGQKETPLMRALLVGTFSVTILLHQIGEEEAYLTWRIGHLSKQVTAQKFWADYIEMKTIDQHLKSQASTPYRFQIDTSKFKQFKLEAVYEKNDSGTERRRTTLAYLFIPALFKKEIEDGKIVVVTN